MALLQNLGLDPKTFTVFAYQSDWHCSKTAYDSETFEDLRYEYWKEHYEAIGIPMDERDDIEVDKLLKPRLHQWLSDNAEAYGFRYSSKKGV